MTDSASVPPGALDFRSAMRSPCSTCAASPCCSYLPLDTFRVRTLAELDYACYLVNFDDIELGVTSTGEWSSFLVRSCAHLQEDGRCGVHATDEQPHVCQQYDPHACWYRPALATGRGDYVRVDRALLDWIRERTEFDEDRVISALPTWQQLREERERRPLPLHEPGRPTERERVRGVSRPAGDDAPVEASRPVASPGLALLSEHDPCGGCSAYCCSNLLFPVSPPDSMSRLDYLRFALGFPGVAVNVVDGAWRLLVETTCRHLEGGRCGIYGQWDRPLRCGAYDAWQCGYVPSLGPQPEDAPPRGITLRADDLPLLADSLGYDADTGEVVAVPDLPTLAAALYVLRAEREARSARQLPVIPAG